MKARVRGSLIVCIDIGIGTALDDNSVHTERGRPIEERSISVAQGNRVLDIVHLEAIGTIRQIVVLEPYRLKQTRACGLVRTVRVARHKGRVAATR